MTTLLQRGHFYGEITLRREIGGVGLSETTHPAGAQAPRHAHEQPYLCLVVAGGFTERFGARSAECGPGTVVFHPAGEEHTDWFGRSGARCFNIQVDAAMLADLERFERPLARAAADGGRPAVAAARLRRAAGEDRLAAPEVEAVVLELLEAVGGRTDARRTGRSRDERRAPPWLARVVERVRARTGDAPPRVAALAAEEGIHPVYLSRTFRRFLGTTPVEYIRRHRLEQATLALVRSASPVARVAADAGFADHSHFCRLFKRAYGLPPSAYRALLS